MILEPLIVQDELAEILGVSKDWLIRNRAKLAREHGFLAPVPGLARPPRWDPVAVRLWLDAQMPARLRPAAPAPEFDWELEAVRRARGEPSRLDAPGGNGRA